MFIMFPLQHMQQDLTPGFTPEEDDNFQPSHLLCFLNSLGFINSTATNVLDFATSVFLQSFLYYHKDDRTMQVNISLICAFQSIF